MIVASASSGLSERLTVTKLADLNTLPAFIYLDDVAAFCGIGDKGLLQIRLKSGQYTLISHAEYNDLNSGLPVRL